MGDIPSVKPVGKTGGNFNPDEKHVYFIASNIGRLKYGGLAHKNLLIAVNEVNTSNDETSVRTWIHQGKLVFLDSGIYSLAMRHAETHGLTHDEGLNTPPDEIDGFAELFERYTSLVRTFGDGLWGYIELDMGGRENKIKTRARLEALGLRPIPVYHPFGDGWDYFDELCSKYDRICFGNIVQANQQTRKRLIATAWERKQKYPHVWIHLLGYTPNQYLNAYPINSGDSSSWLSSVRWAQGYTESTMLTSFRGFGQDYRYKYGEDKDSEVGETKAVRMSAYGSYINQCNWRNHIDALHELGIEAYPDV